MVAYPDRGAGNDPKQFFYFYLFIFFGGGCSLSPPRLNIFTVGNMGVMICLSQEGLRSLSASSLDYKVAVKLYQLSVLLQIHNEVSELFQNLKKFQNF